MRSLVLVAALLLSGCASVVTSKVTTFNDWSAAPAGKSYQFEATPSEAPTLEWRSYQNMVRNELTALNMLEAPAGATPDMRVSLRVKVFDQAYRLVYDPFFGPRFGYWYPNWRSSLYRYGPYYSPFYSPGMSAFPEDYIRHLYKREVHISITSAKDGKRLWEATVRNEDPGSENLEMLPILIHSAFVGFPGPNGGTRSIDIEEKR